MREVTITRVYDAPRELVWRAWTRMVFRSTVPHEAAEGGLRSALDRLAEHLDRERISP